MPVTADESPGYAAATGAEGRVALVLWSPASPEAVARAVEVLLPRIEALATSAGLGWIDFQVQFASALEEAHGAVVDRVHDGHAVTATVLVLGGGGFRLAHLGGGRPLVLQKGVVHPLTREHTEAFALYEAGEIRAGELSARAGTSALTKGLGIPEQDAMEATSAAFRRGDLHPGWKLLVPAGTLQATLGEAGILELLRDPARPAEALSSLRQGWSAEGLAGATLIHVPDPAGRLTLASTGVLGTAPAPAPVLPGDADEATPAPPEAGAEPDEDPALEELPDPDPLEGPASPAAPPEEPPRAAASAPTPDPAPAPETARPLPTSSPPAKRGHRDRRQRFRRQRRGRRKERWVRIGQDSRLDDPVVLGGWLLAASLGVLGLLYWGLTSVLFPGS